ncbi:hypothetical protein MLTONO_5670 [Mesorhizobium loti]|nr:hypothetical protein MLTONO_5670 [Mesorhizobium loti]
MGNIGAFLMLFIPFSVVSCLFMYLAAATRRPPVDSYLAAADASLGFDWPRVLAFVNAFPSISAILVFCYAALGYQVPIVVLLHSIMDRRERVLEFTALVAISLLTTEVIMLAFPAIGPYAFHKPDPASFTHFTGVGVSHLSTIAALHSQAPLEFLVTKTVGLTCFPSFHTALGIIIVYCLRRTVLVIPAAFINAIMIVSTIPEGGHYLIDVVAGAMVAVGSILAVRIIGAYEQAQTDSAARIGSETA